MNWHFFSKQKNLLFLILLLSVVLLIMIFSKIWLGEFAFWYDPARDLLSGLDNLNKPTLIGPTSGIPGVFYGPYWIWFISFAELFSLDPRVITAIVMTIPYILLFPLILSRFSKIINPFVLGMMWLLFLLSFNNYFTDLWNPHLAPLLILLTIYLLFSIANNFSIKNFITTFFAGFAVGLVMNFHLSLGIGMFFGLIIYLSGESIFYFIRTKNKLGLIVQRLIIISVFFLGCIISFVPSFVFEIRHQFFQTQTLLSALFQYGGIVSLQGLTQSEILQNFVGSMAKLLQIPFVFAGGTIFVGLASYVLSYKKRKDLIKEKEAKLLAIVGVISFGVLFIYLTAKNPIWEYHFIGVEIFFLIFIGIIINKSSLLQKLLVGWVIILVAMSAFSFFSKIGSEHKLIFGTLVSEQKIAEKIQIESKSKDYIVFEYNPAIYMYKYSYIFKWMYGKEVPYRPELNPADSDLVFIIIPPNTKQEIKQDYINFRTPPVSYLTTSQWTLGDDTQILKREKQTK